MNLIDHCASEEQRKDIDVIVFVSCLCVYAKFRYTLYVWTLNRASVQQSNTFISDRKEYLWHHYKWQNSATYLTSPATAPTHTSCIHTDNARWTMNDERHCIYLNEIKNQKSFDCHPSTFRLYDHFSVIASYSKRLFSRWLCAHPIQRQAKKIITRKLQFCSILWKQYKLRKSRQEETI